MKGEEKSVGYKLLQQARELVVWEKLLNQTAFTELSSMVYKGNASGVFLASCAGYVVRLADKARADLANEEIAKAKRQIHITRRK